MGYHKEQALSVAMDHNPLVPIINGQSSDQNENPMPGLNAHFGKSNSIPEFIGVGKHLNLGTHI